MLSAPKDITVNPESCLKCLKEEGDVECENADCTLCYPCMNNETVQQFRRAYREHQRRGEMKRLFPTAIYDQPKFAKQLNEINNLQVKWYKEKCEVDAEWC
jgi:hypothetical protein